MSLNLIWITALLLSLVVVHVVLQILSLNFGCFTAFLQLAKCWNLKHIHGINVVESISCTVTWSRGMGCRSNVLFYFIQNFFTLKMRLRRIEKYPLFLFFWYFNFVVGFFNRLILRLNHRFCYCSHWLLFCYVHGIEK